MRANASLTTRSEDPNRPTHPDPVEPDERGIKDLIRGRILLLVHGFAIPEEDAHASYEKFIANLTAVNEFIPGAWGAVCEFHWPGDGGKLAYPLRIETAINSAVRLVAYLNGTPELRGKDLYIVAHSLGCRVTLEAVREIRMLKNKYNGPVVREVILLAAAVRVDDCLPGRSFQTIPKEREHVFFSRRDKVLHHAFGTGQRIAQEPGKAVGLKGLPPSGRWQSRTSTGLDHGEYWGKDAVARRVSAILGCGPVELPEDHLAEVYLDIAEPPPWRTLARRILGRRE
jgi:Alpha/beta hydrolase of unknown function (DUF900)